MQVLKFHHIFLLHQRLGHSSYFVVKIALAHTLSSLKLDIIVYK